MKKLISVAVVCAIIVSALSFGASAATLRRLDLAFVIDTTNSMADDISLVKSDMAAYIDDLNKTEMDYRIAIVDYRDFASRTGVSADYPYKVQLDFTNDFDGIIAGINALDLGYGGDWDETVCSALIDGLSELTWRQEAGKAVILMGDAPALDPEPITNYTKEMAVKKLKYDDTAYEETIFSSALAPQAEKRSAITLFSIATYSSYETQSDFEYLAEGTGGAAYTAEETGDITTIITEIIDYIPEVVEDAELTIWARILNFFKNIWYIITFQWGKIYW